MRMLLAVLGATASVHGVVMRGPVTPVCNADDPCSEPAAALTLAFVRGGVRKTVRTDASGRYAIRLAPGTYRVVVPNGRFGYTPRTFTVRGATTLRVDVFIDTGIR
jgi:hypothetical protein